MRGVVQRKIYSALIRIYIISVVYVKILTKKSTELFKIKTENMKDEQTEVRKCYIISRTSEQIILERETRL